MISAWTMRRNGAFVLLAAVLFTASTAYAADALDLARRLVRYTGGVNLILLNFEGGMAASVADPATFKQSFDQAIADNHAVIAAADEDLAKIYAKLYPIEQMAAEVDFYESPDVQAIMTKSRDTFGVVVWPDPGSMGLERGAERGDHKISRNRQTARRHRCPEFRCHRRNDDRGNDGPGQDPDRRLRQLLQTQRL